MLGLLLCGRITSRSTKFCLRSIMDFISGVYQGKFARLLHSIFIEIPAQVWFRFLSLLIPSSAQFINYTNVSDAVLMDAWKQAQKHLSTVPFPTSGQGTAGNHPPDPRALNVKPKNVTAISVPDTKVSDLIKDWSAWSENKDPSGVIIVPMGQGFLEYNACHAMTFPWARPRVY